MFDRRTLRSRSFWTGAAMIITGIGLALTGEPGNGIQTIAGGLVAIFVRDALRRVQPS